MTDPATEAFLANRELLFAMTYNILGTVADTEDVLQETWLAWSRRAAETAIDHPRAYLVRIAVRAALARQEAIRARRETYVGPWLPEPLVDAPDADSVSLALMVVLETLSPVERVVFVLDEVFAFSHAEIAEALGRTPAAVRQLAHRAREHVQARRPRFRPEPATRRAVTESFSAALLGGDLTAFLRLLAPDVTIWTDGGGKAQAAPRPVHGRDGVARILAGIAGRFPGRVGVRAIRANGDPGVLLLADGEPFGVVALDFDTEGERIAAVYVVTNPDKLSRVPRD
jgi:RNA polymerase sigma factor (sigma-70 family)